MSSTNNQSSLYGKLGTGAGVLGMLIFPHAGMVMAGLVGALCVGGGTALGEAVGKFVTCLQETVTASSLSENRNGSALAALLCGVTGLLAWILPLVGLPITAAGFALGANARFSSRRGMALTGMGLSLLGLLLTSVNGYFGAFLQVGALTGFHN